MKRKPLGHILEKWGVFFPSGFCNAIFCRLLQWTSKKFVPWKNSGIAQIFTKHRPSLSFIMIIGIKGQPVGQV